jgi:iron complex transport system permease protein
MTGTTAIAPDESATASTARTLRAARQRHTARRARVLVALLALMAGLLLAALALGGTARIPLADVLVAAVGRADGLADFVVFDNRLPRALAAILAGALFGIAGSVYQRLIGNPLATPDVLGVTAGASAGAVLVIVTAGGRGLPVQGAALAGALLAVGLIFTLSRSRTASTYRLVLVGIGVGACFASVTNYQLSRAGEDTSAQALRWLIGSLGGTTWDDVRLLGITAVLCVAALVPLASGLENIRLGDDLATGIGTRTGAVRLAGLLLGAVVAAIVTSAVGPVAFVALVAGPVAARLVPGGGVVAAALVGSVLMLGSDVVAQNAPGISPAPVGVVTALIGAPVLVRILVRPRRGA